ncbi:cysteine desulfurase IscS [Betaproteobacteria bacterium]|nr:cysteine desulfurase IscS [Betaproteobacteria bacterium]GHU14398.1 cysteine desulfurase IscS [Betaproteobacteria bacterium]
MSVYLDYNATTPLDERVLSAMLPYLSARYGNASSRHEQGRVARRAVELAREQVAAAAGAHPTEVVFTSGGSEANNLFLQGAAAALGRSGMVAFSAIEHPCVLNAARQLTRRGWRLAELPTDAEGRVTLAGVEAVLNAAEKPELWSLMLANNETGVVQEVETIAARVKAEGNSGGWFHTDAVQAFGKIPVDFRRLNRAGVHALTLSAHKIYGPKGAAALIFDKHLDLIPLIAGGGQEGGLRSGTENVAAIVGFGAAAALVSERLAHLPAHLKTLRERLEAGVRDLGATLFGAGAARLSNTSYFAFAGIEGDTLLARLDRAGFAVASGSACSSANPDPSHVLLAMGVPPTLARGALRVSLGVQTTTTEIDDFLGALKTALSELQKLTALQS